MDPEFANVPDDERNRAIATLLLAFSADPVMRWLYPDGPATVAHLEATVFGDRLDDMLAMFEQMEQAHPTTPLWYLPWFGSDCHRQGEGLGSQLMQRCLEIVDRDHLPAYLDSTNPRNVPFYERHGFQAAAGPRQVRPRPSSRCSGTRADTERHARPRPHCAGAEGTLRCTRQHASNVVRRPA